MTISVVIADDHPMFREGLRFTLERTKDIVVVGEAGDGRSALDLVRQHDPDVVVMDLAMPSSTGARGYLVKGVAPEQVVSAVRALAAGNAVFGPPMAARMMSFFAQQPSEGDDRFAELSPREREVLALLAVGKSNQEIARELVISPITARNHVSSIIAKLHVANRREAMLRFHQRDR